MGKITNVLATTVIALLTLASLLAPMMVQAQAYSPSLPEKADPDMYARAEIATKRLFEPVDGKLTRILQDYVENGVLPDNVVVRNGKLDVLIFATKDADIQEIAKHVQVSGVVELRIGYIIRALVPSPKALEEISELPYVGSIVENVYMDWKKMVQHEQYLIQHYQEAGIEPMNFRARELMQVDRVEEELGINGTGVTICIMDTGVDYAAYDLVDALHRDTEGYVTVFDPGALCIGFTNYTFQKTEDGYLPISSRPYYVVYWGGRFFRTGERYFDIDLSKLPPLKDIYVGDIESKSGVYHFGVLLEAGPWGDDIGALIQVYLCVVVDSKVPGVYDTLYIDFDTSLWLTAKLNDIEGHVQRGLGIGPKEFEALADWDITDETPHYWGDPENNTEILARDIDGDGLFDVSAGMLGNVWDFTGETGVVRFIRGIDPSGNFIGVVYDWIPHGTACATSAAGRGRIGYDVFENGTYYKMYGMARGAKVMAVQAFTRIDIIMGWIWACGWEPVWWDVPAYMFKYTGKHKADIISNSWGYVFFDLMDKSVQGFYRVELLIDILTPPGYAYEGYPGTLFLVSAGNEGPGFMTVGSPSVSPAAISVGATTSYHIFERTYGRPQPYDDVVEWSSRGPSAIGVPKPDVACMGAYGFSAYPLMKEARRKIANQWNCWGWFGGTSMSCPLAAGVCALVVEGYMRAHGHKPRPDVVKYLLKSTADDTGFSPLIQGSGKINAYRAVAAAMGMDELEGTPIVVAYSDRTFKEAARRLDKALAYWWGPGRSLWHGETLEKHPGFTHTLYDTSLYFWTKAGETLTDDVHATTPTGAEIEAAEAYRYVVWDIRTFELGRTKGIYNIYVLTEVLGEDYMENYFYSEQTAFAELVITYEYSDFHKFIEVKAARMPYVFLFDWEDVNKNGAIDIPAENPSAPGEVRRISSCFRGSNVLVMVVGWPGRKFHRYDPTGTWRGPTILFHDTGPETTPLKPWPGVDLKLTIILFKKEPWDWVSVSKINPMMWRVTVSVPEDAQPGVYAGMVEFRKGEGVARMPVCIAVWGTAPKGPDMLTFGGASTGMAYDNGAVIGIYDCSPYARPLNLELRTYFVYVPDEAATHLVTKVTWLHEDTHVGIYVVNEQGILIDMSNMTWLIRGIGWVGTTTMPRGQCLITPIRGSGFYYIVLQVIASGDDYVPEPITLSFCYLTSDVPSSEAHWSVGEGETLIGPHAEVSVSWDQVSLAQLPDFSIKAVELKAMGGHYNYTELRYRGEIQEGWYEMWYKCELYAYQNFTKGQVAYVEVGWNKTFTDTEIDVFVWAPGVNHTYQNSLTQWQTVLGYHANPQKGWFQVPITGVYTIGIDFYWADYDEEQLINETGIEIYVLTSTLRGGSTLANGTSATIDTQVARRNGLIYIFSRAFTWTNVIYEAVITVYVHNFFKPLVSLDNPVPGSTVNGLVNITWTITDENTDEEHVTDVYLLLNETEGWVPLAMGLTNNSVVWDTRPGSPFGAEYLENVSIKLVVFDGKYYVEAVFGGITIDNRPGIVTTQTALIAVAAGAAAAAAAGGYVVIKKKYGS